MKATVALLLMISSVAVLFAQQETKQEPADTLRVGTAAVQMDVLVTDKNGRRITGLTATDFQVLDEGKAQAVDYFTAIEDSRKKTEGSGSTRPQPQQDSPVSSPLTNPYAGRHIVILFDDLSLSADNSLRGRQAIAQYINTKLTSMDMSASKLSAPNGSALTSPWTKHFRPWSRAYASPSRRTSSGIICHR